MFPTMPRYRPEIYRGSESSDEGDDSDSDEGRATDRGPLGITELLDPLRRLEGELDRLELAGTRVHLSLWVGRHRDRDRDMAMLAAVRARRARLEALKVRLLDRPRARAWPGVGCGRCRRGWISGELVLILLTRCD